MKVFATRRVSRGTIEEVERTYPALELSSFESLVRRLVGSVFYGYLPWGNAPPGWSIQWCFPSWPLAQEVWSGENGKTLPKDPRHLVSEQVDAQDPDLFITDEPELFPTEFFEVLRKPPSLRIAVLQEDCGLSMDLRGYDVVFVSSAELEAVAAEHGASDIVWWPTCVEEILPLREPDPVERPVVTYGGEWSESDTILFDLSAHLMRKECQYDLLFRFDSSLPMEAPVAVSMHEDGRRPEEKTGFDDIPCSIQLVLRSDSIEKALRLSAAGAFLFVEDRPGLERWFEPGSGIEIFSSFDDLGERLDRFVQSGRKVDSHDLDKREQMLRDYTPEAHWKRFQDRVAEIEPRNNRSSKSSRKKKNWRLPAVTPEEREKALQRELEASRRREQRGREELERIRKSFAWRVARRLLGRRK